MYSLHISGNIVWVEKTLFLGWLRVKKVHWKSSAIYHSLKTKSSSRETKTYTKSPSRKVTETVWKQRYKQNYLCPDFYWSTHQYVFQVCVSHLHNQVMSLATLLTVCISCSCYKPTECFLLLILLFKRRHAYITLGVALFVVIIQEVSHCMYLIWIQYQ